jgi:hypothetical protein
MTPMLAPAPAVLAGAALSPPQEDNPSAAIPSPAPVIMLNSSLRGAAMSLSVLLLVLINLTPGV